MRGLSTVTAKHAAVTGTALVVIPLALACISPFPAIYTVWLCHILLPYALCMIGTVCGLIPMGLCFASGIAALYYAAGLTAASLGTVYLLPVSAAFIFCFKREMPFMKTSAVIAAAYFLGQLVVYLLLQNLAEGELYVRAANALIEGIDTMEARDSMLYLLWVNGFLALPAEISNDIYIETAQGWSFTAPVRTEFYNIIRSLAQSQLKAYIPASLVTHSLLGGIGGTAAAIHFGKKAAEKRAFKSNTETVVIPDLGMPPFIQWHMAHGIGIRVGILAAGYLFAIYASGDALALAGQMMYAVFSTLYMLQGLAAVNHIQKKRGHKQIWRKLVSALMFALAQPGLVIIGVADQLMDFRGLRGKPASRDGREG